MADFRIINNDIVFEDGDIVFGSQMEADNQDISDIINSSKGEWKENGGLGVDVHRYVGSGGKNLSKLRSLIVANLKYDGFGEVKIKSTSDQNYANLVIGSNDMYTITARRNG